MCFPKLQLGLVNPYITEQEEDTKNGALGTCSHIEDPESCGD